MNGNESSFDQFTHYALGRISRELEALSNIAGIPSRILTARVATLLFTSAGGGTSGVEDSVPTLRGNLPARGETLAALEMVGGAHRKTPRARAQRVLSAAARASIAKAQRKRWREAKRASRTPSKTAAGAAAYWKKNFPTPSARRNEVLRRKRVAARKREEKKLAA